LAVKSVLETKELAVGGVAFVLYKDIQNILQPLGIQDFKVPKGQ
jgi:hypothetical protein